MAPDGFEISDGSLADAVRFAADADTAQLVIVRAGDVVVDEIFDPEPVDVYAVQKGLVSVMFGIAEAHGLLRLDDPVSAFLGDGWTLLPPTSESQLTIRSVLAMTTGMDDELCELGDVNVSWRYNNVAYNHLKTVLELVTDSSMDELAERWLAEPLGMTSTRWVDRPVLRPDGRPITGLVSTAGDLARFGSMVLSGGGTIAPAPYLAGLALPASQENPAWGLCWWNNDQPHHRLPRRESELRPGAVVPGAPPDTLTARGAVENRLYVVPSLDLVVARTASPPRRGERPTPFDRTFWATLSGNADDQ